MYQILFSVKTNRRNGGTVFGRNVEIFTDREPFCDDLKYSHDLFGRKDKRVGKA